MATTLSRLRLRLLYLIPLITHLLIITPPVPSSAASTSDIDVLLKFRQSLVDKNDTLGSWKTNKRGPCEGDSRWVGVLCYKTNIWGLKLENMELSGTIDVDVLKNLTTLRTLSFMRNKFGGPIPEFKKVGWLKSIYLSNNEFKGEIRGDAFASMLSLKKVYMADNGFSGEIPYSLAKAPKLLYLKISGNKFSGGIPEFKHKLRIVDMSNNNLSGPIPETLSKVDASVFAGNKGLCGAPLKDECDFFSNPENKSKALTFMTAIIAVAAILAIIIIIFMANKRKEPVSLEAPNSHNQRKKSSVNDTDDASHRSSRSGTSSKKSEQNIKLSFVNEDREKFDLQDMLRASAEILGSGCFGSSYKAALPNGAVVVVKRFKQMNNVGRDEFQEHMKRLGKLRHPNLLPLVAYFYRKEEKLLISDFVHKGSLAVNLHGHQALCQPNLDWPARLNIIKGVVKGLQYLYSELPSLIAPHGHIKSSNVLLDEYLQPCLTDYGLIPVINQESAQELMGAYRSPEYLQLGRVTKKTDVWGLGILILEITTGRFPSNFLQNYKASNNNNNNNKANDEEDMATWVRNTFKGEWSSEVFDKDMGYVGRSSKGEVVKLLQIGLNCCEEDVEKRLDLKEAAERIEELKEKRIDGNL